MATIFSTLLSALFNWAPWFSGMSGEEGIWSPGGGGEYSLYGLYGDVQLQGTVFYLSVLNKVYNFVSLSEGYCLHDWFDFFDEFCLYFK